MQFRCAIVMMQSKKLIGVPTRRTLILLAYCKTYKEFCQDINQRQELEKMGEEALRKEYGKALAFPVCTEDLIESKKEKVKKCPYCGFTVQTW